MHVFQIYAFGAIIQLLQALKDRHSLDPETERSARATVFEIKEKYGLTPYEVDALADEMETVARLVSLLVLEHNKVMSQFKESAQLQGLTELREAMKRDATSHGLDMLTSIEEVVGTLQEGHDDESKRVAITFLQNRQDCDAAGKQLGDAEEYPGEEF